MITITADTRRAVVTNKELLTSGSAGIEVQFTLSEDWDGLVKLSVFRVGEEGTKVDVALDSSLHCVVPSEVLVEDGEPLFIGVYGANGTGAIIIPTVWASAGLIRPGTEPNTPAEAEPTPAIWEQILSIAQDAEETADAAMSMVESGLEELRDLETSVEDAESLRVQAETARANAENLRANAEALRVNAENLRVNAENARVIAESDRASAETARVQAEASRVQAESARVSAEASRVQAEASRVSAEAYREEKYAEYVQTVTDAADDARASATAAAGSASAAAGSATQAAGSASSASSSASAASSSAGTAAQQASNANASATAAAGSATAANTAKTDAVAAKNAAVTAKTAAEAAQGAAEDAQDAAETAQDAAETAAASVSASAAQIAQNTSDISDLSRQISDETTGLNSKAPVILETASGAIASFDDGADGMPIRKLVAQIEPVQDLHGYDSPWPAGGGKNLLENTATSLESNGVTFTVNSDGTVTCSGTSTGTAVLNMVDPNGINQLTDSLILSGCPAGGDIDTTYGLVATTSDGRRMYADSGNGIPMVNYATFAKLQIVIRSGVNANSLVFKPMIRLASETDATFAPYSNICPISGHTGAEIGHAGKNNLHITAETATSNGVTFTVNSDGTISTSGTASGTAVFRQYLTAADLPSGSDLILNGCPAGGNYYSGYAMFLTASNGSGIGNTDIGSGATYTEAALANLAQMQITIRTGVNANGLVFRPMIRLASETDATFAPYTGNQISVAFPTEAGTVYGGTLTINPDRTGTLNVTYEGAVVDGTHNVSVAVQSGHNRFTIAAVFNSNQHPYTGHQISSVLRNSDAPLGSNNANNAFVVWGRDIYLRADSFATAADLKEYFTQNPQTFVAEFTTPIPYQLTAEQVSGILTTLYGQNNIWANTGDVEVEYPADTKLYIDNKITQAIANALNS